MKILVGLTIAVIGLGVQAASAQDSKPSAAPPPGHSAGLCVLLGATGEVIEARVAQTSGDPDLDRKAVAMARQLQWSAPYPKPGWLGLRVSLSDGRQHPADPGALPQCSAASESAQSGAI